MQRFNPVHEQSLYAAPAPTLLDMPSLSIDTSQTLDIAKIHHRIFVAQHHAESGRQATIFQISICMSDATPFQSYPEPSTIQKDTRRDP